MIALLRNGALTYRAVGERGQPYPEWLRRYRGASRVYVIRDRDTREVFYVGESHSRRLYERGRAEVAVRTTNDNDALDEEARLVRRLHPRDNLIGQTDEAPF